MESYALHARTVGSLLAINGVSAVLWNASTTKDIFATRLSWAKVSTGIDQLGLLRTSTRGVVGSTITPTAQNSFSVGAALPTALLDIDHTIAPLFVDAAAYIARAQSGEGTAGTTISFDPPIAIPPGAGLAVVSTIADDIGPCDIGFCWDE